MSRVVAACMCAAAALAFAQSMPRRDPTVAPGQGATSAARVDPLAAFRPEQILEVDGRRYVLWHGRRFTVGDRIQGARVERIEETQVWLRTDEGVRKLSMYPGVEKSANRERSP